MASKQYKIIQRKYKEGVARRRENYKNPVRRKAVQVIFRDVKPCRF